MHITVVCPSCQKRYHLDPQLQGKNIRCPNPACREIIQVQGVIEPEEPGAPGEPVNYEGTGIVPEDIGMVEIPDDNPITRGRRPPVPGSYSTGKVGDIVPILPAREVPRRPIEPPKGKYQPPARPERRSPAEEMGRPEPRSRQIPPILSRPLQR